MKEGLRRKAKQDESGFSLLEMTITTSIIVTFTAVSGIVGFSAFEKNNKEQAVSAAAQVGYAAAVNAITDFDDDTTPLQALQDVNIDDVVLTHSGDSKEDLCVTGQWFDDSEFASEVGNCDINHTF